MAITQKDIYDAVEHSETTMERKLDKATDEIKSEIQKLRTEIKEEYLTRREYKAEIKPILRLFWGVLTAVAGAVALVLIQLYGRTP